MKIGIVILIVIAFYWLLKNLKRTTNQHYSKASPLPPPPSKTISAPLSFASNRKGLAFHTNAIDRTMNSNDIDDFATFIISPNSVKTSKKSTNLSIGRWMSEYESININGRTIKRGFYYLGGQLEALVGYGTEPSLVDDSLSAASPRIINETSDIHCDGKLGYWPSYEKLSSFCRGTYLDWLASSRNNPDTPIGYVFIYFGGFERRIIENVNNEVVSDNEFIAIYSEVARLHELYGKQDSFGNYAANFLEFMTLIRSPLFEDKALTGHLPKPPTSKPDLRLKMALAKAAVLAKPITADLAWGWLAYSEQYSFKTPAIRCKSEFKQLFDLLYVQNYPNGLPVKSTAKRLKIDYRAASQSIIHVEMILDDLPDITQQSLQIAKLIEIAETCNDMLDGYSRYLGREGARPDDIAAIMLLPKVLIEQQDIPILQEFSVWAQQIIDEAEGLTTVKELWRYLEEPWTDANSSKALSKKQNELIINLVELAGLGIAPDWRYHQSKLTFDSYVVLFKGGHGDDFLPNPSFYQISLALRLGAMVATIDGYVYKTEVDTLLGLIESDTELSNTEKASLTAYLLWRLNTPANMAGLKKKLGALDDHHIQFISRFIISVAMANGKVEPSQIKQIEKLYQALGLDKTLVASDIHHLTTTKRISTGSSEATKTINSNSHSNDKRIKTNTFSFDEDVLALYESETGDAKAMLASIFASDDNDEAEERVENDLNQKDVAVQELVTNNQQITVNSTESSDLESNDIEGNAQSSLTTALVGLDNAHSQLYQQLVTKERWERDEVIALCEPLNLMINGAIETINDWAYDIIDAPLLEDDDEVTIDFESVEEIKQAL